VNVQANSLTTQVSIPVLTFASLTMEMKWSDTGEHLAIIYMNIERRWQLSLYRLGAGQPIKQIVSMDLGELWRSGIYFDWRKDSQDLLFMKELDNENLQLWSLFAETGQLKLVAENIDQHLFFMNRRNEFTKKLPLPITVEGKTSFFLYDVEQAPDDNSWALLANIDKDLSTLWSDNGQYLAIFFATRQDGQYTAHLAMASPKTRQLYQVALPGPIQDWFWLRDNRHLAYIVSVNTEDGRRYFFELLNANTGEVVRLADSMISLARVDQAVSRDELILPWEDANGQNFVDRYTLTGQLRYWFSESSNQVGADIFMLVYDDGFADWARGLPIFDRMQFDQANLAIPSDAKHMGLPSWSASNGYMALPYANTHDMDSLHLYNEQGELLFSQRTPGQEWSSDITWTTCAPASN
jgi:hypothetical protein